MTPEFRAWNKRIKTMITNYHIPYCDDVYGVLLSDVFNDSQVVFEQYTGLKDVNGNKIFEGDIIGSRPDNGTFSIRWNTEHAAFEMWFSGSNSFTGISKSIINDYFIIGNIHENLELLEVE